MGCPLLGCAIKKKGLDGIPWLIVMIGWLIA